MTIREEQALRFLERMRNFLVHNPNHLMGKTANLAQLFWQREQFVDAMYEFDRMASNIRLDEDHRAGIERFVAEVPTEWYLCPALITAEELFNHFFFPECAEVLKIQASRGALIHAA